VRHVSESTCEENAYRYSSEYGIFQLAQRNKRMRRRPGMKQKRDFYRNGELLASVTIANFHGGRIWLLIPIAGIVPFIELSNE
jgi:hypothetical protein